MDEKERHAKGRAQRSRVLGEAHVARSEANGSAFNAELIDLLTRYAWGEIWTRPGLGLRERSLITVAMMTALGRWDELKLHLRGARNNGVTAEEIREVLLQAAIYAGVPAANSAFHLAAEVFDDAVASEDRERKA